ncbi:MAG: tetratricopeptide repeat protein, partial [Myxococcota bacterium]
MKNILHLLALPVLILALPAAAQVTTLIETDGTTGDAGVVDDGGTGVYTIEEGLGDRPGGGQNLFHSFLNFDLGEGDVADFTATNPTERVISRVTGGAPSNIHGTLRSSIPGADFYFINPFGVVIGEGASLDVDGSFHVSTADELRMRTLGGSELLAFSGDAALATAAPSSFGFLGASPASITVEGAVLEPVDGAGLSLVGGPIQIGTSDTTVPETRIALVGGRAAIVSVSEAGDVAIEEHANGLALTPPADDLAGSITIEDGEITLLAPGGGITLEGGEIRIIDSDTDLTDFDPEIQSRGGFVSDLAGGDIVLRASLVILDGAEVEARSDTPNGGAPGAGLQISAESITLMNTARLTAPASGGFPDGNQGGDLRIEARPDGALDTTRLTLTDESLIDTDSQNGGIAGDLEITGFDEIVMSGQSQIRSDATASSRTGDVRITQTGILLMSERSEISSGAFGFSNMNLPDGVDPGSVEITADAVILRSGASIESISVQSGDGGDVIITTGVLRAEDAFIDDREPDPFTKNLTQPSGVSATIGFADSDDVQGGNVEITADEIELLNGGRIAAETVGRGQGGNVVIVADRVLVSGVNEEMADVLESINLGEITPDTGSDVLQISREEDFAHSAIAASSLVPNEAFSDPPQPSSSWTGSDAGVIDLQVGELELRDGGLIAAFTQGVGTGGDVFIDASDRVLVADSSQILTDTEWTSTSTSAIGGAGGSVFIDTPELRLTGDGEISSDVGGGGTGAGGSVSIEAGTVELIAENGQAPEISTDTEGSGGGGDLTIVASERLRIESPSDEAAGGIFANSKFDETGAGGDGDAGSIMIHAAAVEMQGGVIAASTEGSGLGGSITIGPGPDPGAPEVVPQRVDLSKGARISVESLGTGAAGNVDIQVSGMLALSGDSSITTEATQAAGGVINLEAETFHLNNASVTTSVATGAGNGGDVNITAELAALNSGEVRANAEDGNGGNIQIDSDIFIASPDSVLSASSETGVDGVITVSSPDVNVEAGLTQLQVEFASATNLLRPSCAVRSADAREGSFVVAKRRGVPRSPEDLLLAFDAVGGGTGVAALSGAEAQAQVAGSVAPAASAASLAAANAFRGGDLDQAEAHYAEAAKLLSETGSDAKEQGIALRGLAQTQQAAGRYAASLETLRGAVTLAERVDDQPGLASALGGLGNAYVALGRGEEAGPLLQRGITIATEAGETALAAGLWNNLGNQHAAQSAWADAGDAYEEAARLAQAGGDSLAQAKALGNAARAALDAGQPDRAKALLAQAVTRIDALPTSSERAGLRIHAATLWQQLAETPAHRREALLAAHRLGMAALEESQALGAERTRSYALGNLGRLYQREGHRDEALYLTRQAIRSAEAADAPESLYRWYWQEGQLLRDAGDASAALAAYRRSITVLEETREEAQGRYGEAAAYFGRAVAPVYLEMVDLLIARSEGAGLTSGVLLAEARSTVERLKAAELRDYFRDECVAELAAKTTTLEEVSS